MRKPQGYAQVVGDFNGAGIVDLATGVRITDSECDTFTCGHCGAIVHVPPFADPASIGGGCRICDSYICPKCVDLGTCRPQEKMLEEIERKREVATWL